MTTLRNIVIIAVLLFCVLFSGCADKDTNEEEAVTNDTMQEVSVADEALSEEMVGITDTEIEDLESELAELEALIAEMDLAEDIVIEDI
ncbi:hypothetical protein [Methanolobus psychrotolerans]|uniref:hypothetical protein n=1 Tax=Methanolobus psychrotolerans TaxID=1874706 RepID=UPI000B91A6B0|nr:hypothetical protein [Methanolobus psychrotolerans]